MARVAYQDVRRSVQDGDIVLFRGRAVFSMLIRLLTWSRYSHAGLTAWWGDRLLVLEARPLGLAAARLSHVVVGYHGRAELWTARDDSVIVRRDVVVEAAKLELG